MKKVFSSIFKIVKKGAAPKKPKKIKKEKGLKQPAWPIVLTILFWIVENLLTGCSFAEQKNIDEVSTEETYTGILMATPGNYDSADYAVLTKVDATESTMQFQNLETGKLYTLFYDGATTYEDTHGQGMAAAQLSPGMITYITFMKTQKRLNSLALSPESFHYDAVSGYVMDGYNLWIGENYYTISEHVAVLSETGPKGLGDLESVDTLTFYGSGKKIRSIFVNCSHGYLQLENEEFFDGGFLEISPKQIVKIEAGMCVAVPAGNYEVTVSAKGCSGAEKLCIEEGKTTTWDVSAYEAESKESAVNFVIEPADARIYIDGDYVDDKSDVVLNYGIHHIIIVCDGYATISDYIKINQEHQVVEMAMEKKGNAEESVSDNSVSENTVSGNTVSDNSVSENTVSENTIGGIVIPIEPEEKTPSENEAERLREAAEAAAREHGDGSQ